MFLIFLFPAILILLFGLALCKTERAKCVSIWALSLVPALIGGYLAGSASAMKIWLIMALASPIVCVGFAIHTRFVDAITSKHWWGWKTLIVALTLLPLTCIAIGKQQMAKLEAAIQVCKQNVAKEMIASALLPKRSPCCRQKETKPACPVPEGFTLDYLDSERIMFEGNSAGQVAYFDATLQGDIVIWKCHVHPQIFGNTFCKGYDVGWH